MELDKPATQGEMTATAQQGVLARDGGDGGDDADVQEYVIIVGPFDSDDIPRDHQKRVDRRSCRASHHHHHLGLQWRPNGSPRDHVHGHRSCDQLLSWTSDDNKTQGKGSLDSFEEEEVSVPATSESSDFSLRNKSSGQRKDRKPTTE